jgi:phage protein D
MSEPRCIIQVDGKTVLPEDVIESDIENTLYMAADSFEITLTNDDLKSDWFRKKQQVKVYLGYVENPSHWYLHELDHVFTGMIDGVKPKWNSQEGQVVQLIGRDYSAPMIDTQFSIAYANRTSSQIARLMAVKYGLKPIITETTEILPKDVYQDKKEWEILQTLAAREGFVCYVTKDLELYFGPRQEADETVVATISAKGEGLAGSSFEFDDSSVGVYNKVTVLHWHKKQLIEGSAQNDDLIKAMNGQVVEKVITDSKATSIDLANKIAANYLHEYSRQAITGTIEDLPGNTVFVAEKKVKITDAGRFSGIYYIEKVGHKFGKQSGFTSSLDLTNIRPDDAEQYKEDLYPKDRYSMSKSGYIAKGTI